MFLREWLIRQKCDNPKFRVKIFAEKIGTCSNHVWCVANYRYQATVGTALAIQRETGGLVEAWPQMLKCYEENEKRKQAEKQAKPKKGKK